MRSVVICGSSRFEKGIRSFSKELREEGVIVFEPTLYNATGGDLDKVADFDKRFVASGLTHDHFHKMRAADVVFIYNKDGYSGFSTTLEVGFAVALGKPLYALSDKDEEICRHILFHEVIKTPKEFVKRLQ